MSQVFDMAQFQRNLQALERHMPGAGRHALIAAGEQILGGAQRRCPVKPGTLAGSATLDDSAPGEVVIGFNTSYAAPVHERLDVSHPQGEAKFLENEIRESLPRIGRTIADQVRREGLRGG